MAKLKDLTLPELVVEYKQMKAFTNIQLGSAYPTTGGTFYDPIGVTPRDIFNTFNDVFGLGLSEEQLSTLNSLFNTDEEANKRIATEMFKYMLAKKEDN